MNKRTLAMVGLGLTAAASVALTAPAGAATTVSPHTVSAGVFKSIVAAHTVKSARHQCGYPVNNPVLTLGPSTVTAARGSVYELGGTYGCDGHGLTGYPVFLSSTSKAKYGSCSHTEGKTGAYSCVLAARSSGTARSTNQGQTSNSVNLVLQ